MDCLTPEQRHKAMLANKSTNTSIELMLRKALWSKGIRYRKNYRIYNCRPDIVITKYKIAIFCDGEFWHGKRDLDKCASYWKNKIRRNIERDLENTIELRDNGWIVLRFWESDIRKKTGACLQEILKNINLRISYERRMKNEQLEHFIRK